MRLVLTHYQLSTGILYLYSKTLSKNSPSSYMVVVFEILKKRGLVAAGCQPAWEPVHVGLGAGPLGTPAGMGASPCRAVCRPSRDHGRHGSQLMPGCIPVCLETQPACQPAYAGPYAGSLGALAGMAASSCRLGCRPFMSAPPLTCPTGTFC